MLALGILPSSDTALLLKNLEIRIPQRKGRFSSKNGSERHCDEATFVQEPPCVFQILVLSPKSAAGWLCLSQSVSTSCLLTGTGGTFLSFLMVLPSCSLLLLPWFFLIFNLLFSIL